MRQHHQGRAQLRLAHVASITMSSRRQGLLVNSTANWIGYAVRVLVGFAVTPQLIRGLGGQRYGIWSLVESVLAYLSLFDLGIVASLVRYVAKFETERDWKSFNEVFSTTLCLFLGVGLLVLTVVAMLAFGWTRPLGVPAELASEVRFLLMLLGANLAFGLPLGVFPTLFDGLGQYPSKVAVRTSWSLLGSLLLVVFVRGGFGLAAVGLVITACNLAENLTMALVVRRYLPELRFSLGLVNWSTVRSIRGYSACAFLALITGRISFQTDAIVIGAFLTPQFITLFMIAARLVEYAKDSARSIALTFTSAVSAFEARRDLGSIRGLFLNGTRFLLWLIVPLQVGFLTLGKAFLALWIGAGYAVSVFPVLVILAVPLTLAIGQAVAARVLYGIGRLRPYTLVLLLEAFANLALSLWLIGPLGIQGVALGTTIPNVLANLVVILYVCRILGVSLGEYLAVAWMKPLLLGGLLAVFWLGAERWIPLTSWGAFIAIGTIGVMGYATLAALIEYGPRRMVDLVNQPFLLPRA